MDNDEIKIGYLKYSGKSVDDGFMDARKSAEALLGFDEILRYFISKEDLDLNGADFEIPVKIEKGSWIIIIGGIIVTAYFTKAAQESAEKGLLNTATAKDIEIIAKSALKSAQWVIRISSHLKSLTVKEFKTGVILQETQEIEILNSKKDRLTVPKKYLDLYSECPPKIFSKSASIIEDGRVLEFVVCSNDSEEKVTISNHEKGIFYHENENNNEILFPELKHGQNVQLEGTITRGNEKTNTIGFEYEGHILTCMPREGNIVNYKSKLVSRKRNHLFPRIKIIGFVDRTDRNGEFKDKRPMIIFSDIMLLENHEKNQTLFG